MTEIPKCVKGTGGRTNESPMKVCDKVLNLGWRGSQEGLREMILFILSTGYLVTGECRSTLGRGNSFWLK